MFSYGYLQTNICPSPECSLQVYNPSNSQRSRSVNAVVDTGAVMTCIPESVIRRIGNLVKGENVDMQDANGNKQSKETYFVNLRIGMYEFPDFRVIILPSKKYALIGRDVLNQQKIMLDGQCEEWRLNCEGNCEVPSLIIPGEPGE